MSTTPLCTPSANLKKALQWVSETLCNDTARSRQQVFREAELRFDLTPAECQFLDQNLVDCPKPDDLEPEK